MNDDRRPWIRKECKAFVSTMKRAGASIQYKLHFENDEQSLDNHFKIIDSFY